jgi:hypothetical protein
MNPNLGFYCAVLRLGGCLPRELASPCAVFPLGVVVPRLYLATARHFRPSDALCGSAPVRSLCQPSTAAGLSSRFFAWRMLCVGCLFVWLPPRFRAGQVCTWCCRLHSYNDPPRLARLHRCGFFFGFGLCKLALFHFRPCPTLQHGVLPQPPAVQPLSKSSQMLASNDVRFSSAGGDSLVREKVKAAPYLALWHGREHKKLTKSWAGPEP